MNTKSILQSIFIALLLCTANFANAACINITTNTTWTTNTTVSSCVVINQGATLTINSGVTVTMGSGAYIYVATSSSTSTNGGRIVADGVTFQSLSTNQWDGVYIAGDKTLSQQSSRMAKGTFTNCTFKKMQFGITNWDLLTDYNANTTGGGIIVASNCTFSNNGYGVNMSHYQNFLITNSSIKLNDYSNFYKCTFTRIAGNSPASAAFVRLHDVEGVHFSGTSMSVASSVGGKNATGGITERGFWLESAGAIIEDACNSPIIYFGQPCSNITQTQFNSLKYGIYSVAPYNTHKISVTKALFTNCRYGIHINGTQNPVILQNEFQIYTDGTNKQSGIALEACTGYRVEQNTINVNSPSSSALTYGIEITNSGENSNELYKNTVAKANYAIQANGINRHVNQIQAGTRLLCNGMSNTLTNAYDVTVPTTPGISNIQAGYAISNSLTAGNTFSSSFTCTNANQFRNNGLSVAYYCNAYCPTCYTTTSISLVTADVENTCPSKISTSGFPYFITFGTYISIKGDLESQIDATTESARLDDLLAQYREVNNRMITTYLGYYDSLGTARLDSVIYVLGTCKYIYDYHVMKAGVEMQLGLFSDATSTLSRITSNFSLNKEERTRVNSIEDIVDIATRLNEADNDWRSLSEDDRSLIGAMVTEDDFLAGYMARYYLSAYEDSVFAPNLLHLNTSNQWVIARKAKFVDETVTVYPNPSGKSIQLTGVTSGELVVYDMMGKKVLNHKLLNGNEEISVQTLMTGVYIIQVKDGGGKVHTIRFSKL